MVSYPDVFEAEHPSCLARGPGSRFDHESVERVRPTQAQRMLDRDAAFKTWGRSVMNTLPERRITIHCGDDASPLRKPSRRPSGGAQASSEGMAAVV